MKVDLVSSVHLVAPDGNPSVFLPGDDVPEWALRRMGNHCFEDGVHPLGRPAPVQPELSVAEPPKAKPAAHQPPRPTRKVTRRS